MRPEPINDAMARAAQVDPDIGSSIVHASNLRASATCRRTIVDLGPARASMRYSSRLRSGVASRARSTIDVQDQRGGGWGHACGAGIKPLGAAADVRPAGAILESTMRIVHYFDYKSPYAY
ncbi:MAG: hypothetical protein KDK91_24315, partial [Gammaproteobacteria bacterium]|nr:hypothetical protein [Gammaproteobacteria bacterium]